MCGVVCTFKIKTHRLPCPQRTQLKHSRNTNLILASRLWRIDYHVLGQTFPLSPVFLLVPNQLSKTFCRIKAKSLEPDSKHESSYAKLQKKTCKHRGGFPDCACHACIHGAPSATTAGLSGTSTTAASDLLRCLELRHGGFDVIGLTPRGASCPRYLEKGSSSFLPTSGAVGSTPWGFLTPRKKVTLPRLQHI